MNKLKNTLFDSLKREDLSRITLLRAKFEKEELSRLSFKKDEYDDIVAYCARLGYLSEKKEKGKLVFNNNEIVYASPSINEQRKTIKIYNSKTHRWGYLQKLKNGIFYGYFVKDENDNAKFVPKYNFQNNLDMFKVFSNLSTIDLTRLKAAAGIVELEMK